MNKSACLILGVAFLYSCSSTKQNLTKLENEIKFSVSPVSIYVGDTAKLSWSIPNEVKNAKINISGFDDNLSNTGFKNVSPSNSKEYKLTVEKKGKSLTKSLNLVVKEKPSIENFTANPLLVNKGDSTELSWSTKNITDEKIIIEGLNGTEKSGKTKIKIDGDTTFTLKIVNNENKTFEEKKVSLKVNEDFLPKNLSSNSTINVKNSSDKKISFSEGPDDGRYTLGGNGKRLMYGWPFPLSTSHFVIKVNDNYGTNYNRLSGKNIYFISSKLFTKGEKGSLYNEIAYFLDGVKIIQRMIPVDKNFKTVKMNTYGQYYKIEYEIINTTKEDKNVGMISLTDLMMDDNDGPTLEAKGKKIESISSFTKKDLPDELLVYKTSGNKNDHTGKFVFNQEAVKPDFMYVGRWPYFNSVSWNINSESGAFIDNALLLKWDDGKLKPEEKRTVSFYFGLFNDGQISMVSSINNLIQNKITVFFKSGSSNVTSLAKKTIDAEIAKITGEVKGALVAGFSDARGAEKANVKISQKRINESMRYLDGKKGLKKGLMIPKAYGESASDQSAKSKRKGNENDRKCEIIIFSVQK
jgi:outer membrane protein OmpA-like peptidoglycan-associated protein